LAALGKGRPNALFFAGDLGQCCAMTSCGSGPSTENVRAGDAARAADTSELAVFAIACPHQKAGQFPTLRRAPIRRRERAAG
jgi:hypothetical protein